MNQNQSREIRGVLIPISSGRVLLPSATVAEVITYSAPEAIADAPQWLLGRLSWRGWRLPLFSFAQLAGVIDEESLSNARVVVLKTLNNNLKLPFIAMLAQGFPRLTTITPEFLVVVEQDAAKLAIGVQAQIFIHDERAVIPDLLQIEAQIDRVLNAA